MAKQYWFSSDWHLGHKNILKYDPRPFPTITDHDQCILSNQRKLVSDRDDFYFLGDFCLDHGKADLYMSALKGNLFFIKGNHDRKDMIKLYEKYGTYLGQLADVKINGQHIVLCHYRMEVWNRSHHGSWMLHGHSHHALRPSGKLTLDLGINGHDYKPLNFDQIKGIMSKARSPVCTCHNAMVDDRDLYCTVHGR